MELEIGKTGMTLLGESIPDVQRRVKQSFKVREITNDILEVQKVLVATALREGEADVEELAEDKTCGFCVEQWNAHGGFSARG